ncbi:MAG: NAD(P)/FAD-dependent oxidoreductase [Clostridia bacterium]|jgi:thioredoxin reductase (NADPH)|nr:NAD(P)/FAD-dependent oxidoreductase [Clostridia bacterium]
MEIVNTDILIVGCGPAGLSAAINTTIRNKKTLIYGGDFCSPKLNKAPHISNYLGFWDITGEELRQKYLEHVRSLGISIEKQRIDNIYPAPGNITVVSKGKMISAKALILAIGLQNPRYLPGEESLLGKGVGYCATCDGPLYKGKRVAVIGYTKEGEEEANFLADLAQEITYLPLYEGLGELKDNIKVVKAKPKSILGKEKLQGLETEGETLELDGLFIIRESVPPAQILPGLQIEKNAIIVDRSMATNIEGIFAAGDCTGAPYQLAKAVGEGTVAGLSAASYVDKLSKLK